MYTQPQQHTKESIIYIISYHILPLIQCRYKNTMTKPNDHYSQYLFQALHDRQQSGRVKDRYNFGRTQTIQCIDPFRDTDVGSPLHLLLEQCLRIGVEMKYQFRSIYCRSLWMKAFIFERKRVFINRCRFIDRT
jgi:hypothetical protein